MNFCFLLTCSLSVIYTYIHILAALILLSSVHVLIVNQDLLPLCNLLACYQILELGFSGRHIHQPSTKKEGYLLSISLERLGLGTDMQSRTSANLHTCTKGPC